MATLTHVDEKSRVRMVDVSGKAATSRRALAAGRLRVTSAISRAIRADAVAKGNVFETAKLGAIQAAKRTAELIPLCHPLPITSIRVEIRLSGLNVLIAAEVRAEAKTGVEMEALTAVATACLIVYDMCKGIDKGMVIGPIELLEKEGGKSGHYRKKSVSGKRGTRKR
ncbi:MAG TPA: cyclic pyranopterin monophosphate synthase MoaC [Acidobacteriota bacterium]|nr:cyclic pyranopterin monophosphate synthase MoaC [Acidobacteriota bacterium]